MVFIPKVNPPGKRESEAIWFAFQNGQLLMFEDADGCLVPQLQEFSSLGIPIESEHYLGTFHGQDCYALSISADIELPEPYFLQEMRRLAMEVDESIFSLAGRAIQVIQWDRDHQFCSRCGTSTEQHETDRAKCCPRCGYTQYPRISPCIITLITRGEYILLGRSPNWPLDMFSTLAGFVEPGETLEEAVHREVMEEVNIRITELQYMGSQPWPFPHSLMVGFYAEYNGGEIEVDGIEIEDAQWFHVSELPRIPPKGSISRTLIDNYISSLQGYGLKR